MKAINLILVVIAAAMVAGCASVPREELSGAWTTSYFGNDMLICLDRSGRWSWWDTKEAPPPQPPTQEGRWFVHESILVLRVEKSESDKLPPGLAFTFDLRAATKARLTLYDLQTEREMYWARPANQQSEGIRR